MCARTNQNSFATSRWLSNKYMDTFKDNDNWSAVNFMHKVQKDLVLECSKMKAYRAKFFATKVIEGAYKEQYASLWNYGLEIKRSNPGSTVEFLTDANEQGKPIFKGYTFVISVVNLASSRVVDM